MRASAQRGSLLLMVGLLVFSLGGCGFFRSLFGGSGRTEAERRIEWARKIAGEEDPDGEDLARAGWVLLLYANDADGAGEAFGHPSAKPEPEAALGRAELERSRLHPREAGAAYLEVLKIAPHGIPGEIAQSRLEGITSLDAELDAHIAAALEKLVADPETDPRRRVEARRQRLEIFVERGDLEGATALAMESQPEAFVVVGPFSRYRALHARRAFGPEMDPLLRASPSGPYAGLKGAGEFEVKPRWIPVGPTGLNLRALPRWGDIHYALTDLLLEEEQDLLIAWESGRDLRIMVDGLQLMRRDALEGREPSRGVLPLTLAAGRHRLAIRFLRRAGGGTVKVALLGADGRKAKLHFDTEHLDQEISEPLTRESDPLETWRPGDDPVELFWATLLEGERDPPRARATLRRYLLRVPHSGLGHLHAVQILTADPDVGSSLATGRMAQHLQQATALIPHLAATWAVEGAFAFEQSHTARAREAFQKAAKLSPGSPRLADVWARYLLERGHAVLAERHLQQALGEWPEACSLWSVAFQVRTDEESLAAQDAAADRLRGCGLEGLDHWATHQAERGERGAALEARRRLLAYQPERIGRRLDIARVLTSLEREAQAEKILAEGSELWPEASSLLRERAFLSDRLGASARATRLRRELLRADPEALSTRRALAFLDGEQLLAWGARDLEADIQAYLEAGQALRAGANAVEVVDHAVAEVFTDDPRRPVIVERIQSVTEVLTKEGLDRYGEVSLPSGAEVIDLYVRKPDGRRLYADAVMGRESLSLPGLEPGDFIVTDILTQVGSRGAALPGWSANAFYFRIYELPLYRSSYLLRAPKALPLEVDAHQLEVAAPTVEGEYRVFRHVVENASMLHPEAGAPGSAEILPWIRIGAGIGPAGYGFIWGDYLQARDRPSPAMVRLARKIEKEVRGSDVGAPRTLVMALAREVNSRIAGAVSSSEFDATAAQIFAAGRGNRLLVLRGLLRALEIDSQVAFVRSFRSDPAAYRFPGPRRFTHAVLRVPMLTGGPLWIDPSVRGAPLGTLRPVHANQPVLILATPEKNPIETRTPAYSLSLEQQETEVEAQLTAEGSVKILGRELYRGHSGAAVRISLESMEADRKRQAIQGLLASYFGPVLLDTLAFENDTVKVEPGAPLTIHYLFEAPSWVQKQGDKLILPGAFFPMRLGRAMLRHGSRELPLLLDRGSPTRVTVQLELPEGYGLVGERPELKLESPFGTFEQTVKLSPEGIEIQRSLLMPLGRVKAADYPDFAAFLIQIDALEARPLIFAPGGSRETTASR